MTRPPTLTEMKNSLVEATITPPTLSEMMHSLEYDSSFSPAFSELIDVLGEDVLIHFGIKGMRWGVRRSDKELGKNRIKNEDGEDVGGIRAKSRAAASKLRGMKPGEVMVLDTEGSGPKVLVKQKDGSFKEAHLSADAQSVLRTLHKDPASMSTREMSEATKRAQAIEQYNKFFNPLADPNAELKARVEAMELQSRISLANAKANPSPAQKLGKFFNDVSPAFETYSKVDKMLGGAISDNLKKSLGFGIDPPKKENTPKEKESTPQQKAQTSSKKKKKPKNNDAIMTFNLTQKPGETLSEFNARYTHEERAHFAKLGIIV